MLGDHADIYLVRTTRARIIRLRNDYKALMSKIEAGLHHHHASIQSTTPTAPARLREKPEEEQAGSLSGHRPFETAFARVNSVVAGSPADEAGLKAGDKIRAFDNVNWMNHEKLSKVAEVVQRSEGVSQPTKVPRLPLTASIA